MCHDILLGIGVLSGSTDAGNSGFTKGGHIAKYPRCRPQYLWRIIGNDDASGRRHINIPQGAEKDGERLKQGTACQRSLRSLIPLEWRIEKEGTFYDGEYTPAYCDCQHLSQFGILPIR